MTTKYVSKTIRHWFTHDRKNGIRMGNVPYNPVTEMRVGIVTVAKQISKRRMPVHIGRLRRKNGLPQGIRVSAALGQAVRQTVLRDHMCQVMDGAMTGFVT